MVFLALAWAQPSVACMDVNGPAYLLDRPPKSAPPGLALLKLRSPVAQPGNGSKFVAATIAGGVPALIGRRILIEVPPGDSCTYWSQSGSSRYVIGRVYRSAGQLRLLPKAYLTRTR